MQKFGQLDLQLLGDNEVLFNRLFDASPQHVFDAHTKPELVKRWLLGPPGWSMPVCEIDFRVGGKYRYEWAHPEQGSFGMGGEYIEIDAPTKIRHSEAFEENVAMNVITFTAQGGKTLMSLKVTYDSSEAREAALATGMADGMESSYVNLDGMFAEAK
jgi:uncharacterized protein YndB with AHSA1/START domain